MDAKPHSMPMPAWGDREIARFTFRFALFRRRGIDSDRAESLADQCASRDYQGDLRRMCIECGHWQRGNTCFSIAQGWVASADKRAPYVIPDLFINCPHFTWQKPQ